MSEDLYKEFHEKFPIEKLQKMTLGEYVNDENDSGFLWWMLDPTFGTIGNTNYTINRNPFGIYTLKGKATFSQNTNTQSDDQYIWQGKYGNTANEAFKKIREYICEVAENAHKFALEEKESILQIIDKNPLPNQLKWKIAFLYSEKKLVDCYAENKLKELLQTLAPDIKEKHISGLQYQLSIIKKAKPTELAKVLATLWLPKNQKNKNNNNNEDRTMTNTEEPTLAQECAELLKNTKNVILHGAPGTGKTYLAKQIAQQMIFGEVKQELSDEEQKNFNEQVELVQFHPSYDYTDFVEGLRPVKNDEENQIGFERKNGQFKEFCKQALKTTIKDSADNFELKWKELIETLNNQDFIDIPLSKGNRTMKIELNEYGTGLANRTYENDEYKKGDWIRGQSKFFNKDQLYNVYKGLPGVPSGGHDNYRQAIINYMKNNMNLLEYKQGTSNPEKAKPFIFIIDEINRGELSKIFGELFFAIDPGYRGESGKIKTQYQNLVESGDAFADGFFVPENVYIIGTMNDIDRSVESMDLAMRRRFTFKEITAEKSREMILTESNEKLSKLPKDTNIITRLNNRMTNLNNKIISDEIGLSTDYQIGAAYFLKFTDYYSIENDSDKAFNDLWEYNLKPLLREYLRGQGDIESKLTKLEAAYNDDQKH